MDPRWMGQDTNDPATPSMLKIRTLDTSSMSTLSLIEQVLILEHFCAQAYLER